MHFLRRFKMRKYDTFSVPLAQFPNIIIRVLFIALHVAMQNPTAKKGLLQNRKKLDIVCFNE